MTGPAHHTTHHRLLSPWVLPIGAAVLSMWLGQLLGWVSPLLVALALGALATNAASPGLRRHLDAVTTAGVGTLMLRLGILLIGFRLSVDHLVAIGVRGVLIAVLTVAISLTTTRWLGRRLGLDDDLAHLLAAGCPCAAQPRSPPSRTVCAPSNDTLPLRLPWSPFSAPHGSP